MSLLDGLRSLLVIGAHPDDETLAAGGLLARARQNGAETYVLSFVTGDHAQYGSHSDEATRHQEFEAAMAALGVSGWDLSFPPEHHLRLDAVPQKELLDHIEHRSPMSLQAVRPDAVVVPVAGYNQDHVAVASACISALRVYPPSLRHTPQLVLGYTNFDEQCWHVHQEHGMRSSVWIDIHEVLEIKCRAVLCYGSQIKRDPLHWRSAPNIEHIARVTGLRAGLAAAEEFVCLRALV